MIYAAIFVLGCVAALALRRVALVVLRGVLLVVGVAIGGRLLIMADARPEWLTSVVIGGIMGFLVIGVLSYASIWHALVRADEQRAVQKAHDDAKRRRLW